jgi:hypothetical protein
MYASNKGRLGGPKPGGSSGALRRCYTLIAVATVLLG